MLIIYSPFPWLVFKWLERDKEWHLAAFQPYRNTLMCVSRYISNWKDLTGWKQKQIFLTYSPRSKFFYVIFSQGTGTCSYEGNAYLNVTKDGFNYMAIKRYTNDYIEICWHICCCMENDSLSKRIGLGSGDVCNCQLVSNLCPSNRKRLWGCIIHRGNPPRQPHPSG